ncbi:MAG: hypothetical protein EON59_03405 [Alphaproteobacteria bacterium]|nr:MAG: hypothetical protein EON59_03405 [Alphaproteobacteria bacterium]
MTNDIQTEMQSPEDAMIEISATSAAYCSLISDLFVILAADEPADLIALRDRAKLNMLEATANPIEAGLSRVTYATTRFEIIDDACNRLGHPAPSTAEVISLSDRSLN